MLPEPFIPLECLPLARVKSVPGLSPAQPLLSAFDRALIRLVSQGVPDRVMAQRLAISEADLKAALLSVFRKLAEAGLLDQLLFSEYETEQIAC